MRNILGLVKNAMAGVSEESAFSLPKPVPGPGERLVHVEKYVELESDHSYRESTYKYPHQLAKLAFFLRSEGPKLTMRKVRASWLQLAVGAKRRLLFIVGAADG